MSSFLGLVKKEFRLTRKWFLTGFVIQLLIIAISYFRYYDHDFKYQTLVPLSLLLIGFHFFYLIIYMFSSLRTEADKMHLWLHNPQPARNLLLAKILNGLMALIISLGLSLIFALIVAKLLEAKIPVGYWGPIYDIAIFIIVNMVAASIYITMWFVMAWTVYQTLKIKYGRLSWLGVIGVIWIPPYLLTNFAETSFYRYLTGWGEITITFFSELRRLGLPPNASIEQGDPTVTIGFYIFNLIVVLLFFFLSSWLLDKKVEV